MIGESDACGRAVPLSLAHISPEEALHNAVDSPQQYTALSVNVTPVFALQRGPCRCQWSSEWQRRGTKQCQTVSKQPGENRYGQTFEVMRSRHAPKANGAPQPIAQAAAMSAAFPVASCRQTEPSKESEAHKRPLCLQASTHVLIKGNYACHA